MSQPQRNYGPASPYGSKIKSTREFLDKFLKLCRERRPCDVGYAKHHIYWEMRKEMLAANPKESFDKKCARIQCNALQRITDAYHHYNPDTPMTDVYAEMCLLTIDEYIGLVEAAVDLPKEACRDGSTSD